MTLSTEAPIRSRPLDHLDGLARHLAEIGKAGEATAARNILAELKPSAHDWQYHVVQAPRANPETSVQFVLALVGLCARCGLARSVHVDFELNTAAEYGYGLPPIDVWFDRTGDCAVAA